MLMGLGFFAGLKFGAVPVILVCLSIIAVIILWMLFSWFCDWLDGISS
jgi:hypothetical protein